MTSNSNQKPTKEHRRHLDRIALSLRRSVGTKRLGFIDQRLPSYVTQRSSCPRFSSVSRPLIVEGHHHPSDSARQIRLWPNTSIPLHTAIVLSGFRSLLVYPITSSKMSGSDMISPSQIGSDVTQRWVHRSENINQCICGLYIYYSGVCGHAFQEFPVYCGARTSISGRTGFCSAPIPRNIVDAKKVNAKCRFC